MKNIILITFIFFLYSCGYTTVYKNIGEQDFRIIITEMKGDREMNNLIKNEINRYSNKDSINKFDVSIQTKYEKLVLTKDSAGVITDYELSAKSEFIIYFNENSRKVTFSESININNQNDNFEQDSYERNNKVNFASSLREKLLSEVITMQYGEGVITKQ